MWTLLTRTSFLNVKTVEEPYVSKNVEVMVPLLVRQLSNVMEGTTNLQRQTLENKEKEGDAETVRGQQELPALLEWGAASSGPVGLSDWLAMIEPCWPTCRRLQRDGGRSSR